MLFLFLHISFHFLLSLIAGFIVYYFWKKPAWAFTSAIIGGVAVDFDHFIDYFLAFGLNFKLNYFANGYEFLKTDKLYLLFHGWEYVIILLILSLLFKNRVIKSIMVGLSLGLFLHLVTDVNLNKIPASTYSIINRYSKDFNLEKLVTPKHWERHKTLKQYSEF